jgi:hypothetical protein
LPRETREAVTRVEEYCSKLWRKVACWRRSKDSTAWSCATPAKALWITALETPAACASRPMAERKALKSPPHCAACAGAERSSKETKPARDSLRIIDLIFPRWWAL